MSALTKKQTETVAHGLNENQQHAMRRILENAEYDRQVSSSGNKRLLRANCQVGSTYRTGISASTARSLIKRGLLTPGSYFNHFTEAGMKVAKFLFVEWSQNGTTVTDYVAERIAHSKQVEQDRADKVKRAKHLFRNIKLDEKTMAYYIGESLTRTRAGGRDQLRLGLDDVIQIGEQIEKLR